MAEQNKILTVSYGTFSCTLEGFEDSFGTMKAIAEYFRDLAADDRYFGAEPPTPDPEMLSRIAEREIERRVEARTSDQGIVLRAAQALTAPAPAATPAATPVESIDPVGEEPAASSSGETAEATTDAVEVAPDTGVATTDTGDTPQPQAVDAAPDQAGGDDDAQSDDVADEDVADAADGTSVEATADGAAEAEEAAEDTPDAAVEPSAETMAEADAETGSEVTDAADAAEDLLAASDPEDAAEEDAADQATAEPDPDSVAAKLQRIRAVVGQGGALVAADEDVEAAMAEESGTETVLADAEPADAPLDLGALGRLVAEDDRSADADDASDEDRVPEVAADAADPVRARVVRLSQDAAATEDDETVDGTDDAPGVSGDSGYGGLAALDGAEEYDDSIDGEAVDLTTDLDDDLLEELAMVEAEAGEMADEDGISEAVPTEEEESSSDAEEIAGTVRAAETKVEEWKSITEAGTQGDDELIDDDEPENAFADIADDEPESAEASDRTGRDRLTEATDADTAVARLMSEADAKMNEPENRGRREAISHLKAAVAAKEAARQLGEEDDTAGGDENAFREDLDEVVRPGHPSRPTRPVGDRGRTERPRPAPLKLVASQRIDAPAEEAPAKSDSSPVRPRRVSREAPNVQQAEGAFSSWAEQRGAFSLTDLVEAAAAHTLSVDGVEAFSRPQVMRKVRAARTAEQANREDELRAFGTLLRQGRFTKVRAGRFHLAEDSRFLEAPRAARG